MHAAQQKAFTRKAALISAALRAGVDQGRSTGTQARGTATQASTGTGGTATAQSSKASVGKRSQRGGVLARLGDQPHQASGPKARSSSSRIARPAVKQAKFAVAPAAHQLEGVPLTHMVAGSNSLEHVEPALVNRNGTQVLVGSEFLSQIVIPPAIGGTTSVVPQGGAMCAPVPLNPLCVDGLRVSRELSLFDQFRIKHLAIEYVPMCPMTQAGGFTGVVTNDPSDNISLLGGALALRDALSRPGVELCSVNAPAVTRENTPLLKWFNTSSGPDPTLVVPGIFNLLATTDLSNATTSPIPLGILWMHYEIEVRSPSFEAAPSLAYTPQGGYSLSFTNVAETAIDTVRVPIANLPIPAAFATSAVVFAFVVVAADDTIGNTLWRTWTDRSRGQNVTIAPGMVVYARCADNGIAYEFFPTLDAAMYGDLAGADGADLHVSYAWSRTAAANPTSHGFKIAYVSGFNVTAAL